MRTLVLGLGLFLVFLIARNTFTMQAEGTAGIRERPSRADTAEARMRRLAAFEEEDRLLLLRQQALEGDLEQCTDAVRRLQDRIDRTAIVPVETGELSDPVGDLHLEHAALIQRCRESRAELDRVAADRQRLREEWIRSADGASLTRTAR